MGDVITIAVDLERKGFEKGCTELRGAITSLSQTAKKMADGMKSIIPSIIGVGSAFGILTKAASTFMQQNVMLTRQMEAVWTALGNLIGPIVEQLVSWVVSAVSYLISFLNLLGITGKTASELSKKAKTSTTELQRTVAGFDELNVLQPQQQSGVLPNLTPKEWMSELSDLLKAGQFAEAGRYLAAQLNEMVANIDWVGIGDKLAYGFKAAVDFLGNFIRDFDVHSLGRYVADMVNRILNIDTSGEDTWRNLGEILVSKFTLIFDFVTGFLEGIDSTALAAAVSGTLIGAIEALSDSIATADWQKISENIINFFVKIDWSGLAKAIWAVFTTAVKAIIGVVAGAVDYVKNHWAEVEAWFLDVGTRINQWYSDFMAGMSESWSNFGEFVGGIWNGIVLVVKSAINSIIGCVNGMISGVVSGINSVSSVLNGLRFTIPNWVPTFGGSTFGFSLPTFSAPQIPYLEKGGVLKKGQVGLLEGSGAEAVVPLEKNTGWINKMAETFLARVQAGNYDLTGNAKTIAALEAIADRVTYRAPTVAAGQILPYSVSSQAAGSGSLDSAGTYELLQSISDKLDRLDQLEEMVYLLANMQFVADFGDNIRALARKITKEQRRDKISEGR